MSVTARMRCHFIQEYHKDTDNECRVVNLSPVYSSDPDSPNYSYSKATPGGQLSLTISNPAAFEQFELNAEYDMVFTKRDV